jgi:HK97 family phage portal protein
MPLLRSYLEARNIENPLYPLTSTALVDALTAGERTSSGVSVTPERALRHIAVYRCVELIAGTCAALPLKAYRRPDRDRVDAPVLDDPHPELTSFEVWETAYASLLLWGNAYFWKGTDGTGRIRRLWPIHPARVHVDLVDPDSDVPGEMGAGTKRFKITDAKGGTKEYTRTEILHIPGLGYDGRVGMSRIRLAAQGIGVGLAAEEYAGRLFANGSLFSGILKVQQSLSGKPDVASRLKQMWREKVGGLDKAHEIAVLDSGAEFQPISMPPEDAQLLESRGYSTTEVARLFGLPPHAIGDISKSTSWGTGIEQQTIGMVQFTLQPSYLTRVEQRITKEVLLRPDVFAEYTIEGLLRGDSKSRAAFYQAMVAMRAMNPNEVRVRENLPPYEGGDEFLNPNIDVAAPGDEPADDEVPADDEDDDERQLAKVVGLASRLAR